MTRNWDAEWQQVSAAHTRSLEDLQEAMTIVTGRFLGDQGPSGEQMVRAESARKAWQDSTRDIEIWLDEWRAAHGPQP